MSTTVWFDGSKATVDPFYGLPLTPGRNEIRDKRASLLLDLGVVRTDERRPLSRRRR